MQSLTTRETVKQSFAGKKEMQSSLSQLDEKCSGENHSRKPGGKRGNRHNHSYGSESQTEDQSGKKIHIDL